ncbi:hypothetical protein CYMTET_30969, partial [Cymbomonas tetramitiformis]
MRPVELLADILPANLKGKISTSDAVEVATEVFTALRNEIPFQQFISQLTAQGIEGVAAQFDAASKAKAVGNRAFSAGQYAKAAESYSTCLRALDAGTAEGRSLAAIVYANRAACVLRFETPEYAAAIEDASRAIEADPSYPKGWMRRARALEGCGRLREASDAAETALELARQATSDSRGSLMTDLAQLAERLRGLCCEPAGEDKPEPAAEPRTEPGGRSSPCSWDPHAGPAEEALLRAAAPGLRLQTSKTAGRYATAARELRAGEVVLRETEPLAAVVCKRRRANCCAWCFEAVAPWAVVPCARCAVPTYCSSKCREADSGPGAAASTHRGNHECGMPWAA